MASFRDGNNEAFRVIYDRYRQRLFAYTRQMLPGSRQDAEDALQDVFVRAFGGLRADDRELALRAWLYRIAHNRCIDELRRPAPPGPELMELVRPPLHDPIAEAEQREALRRLIADVRRLPDQQRSALLMRELAGMSYVEIADALCDLCPGGEVAAGSGPGRAGPGAEARDTSCSEIREDLILAHDRGVRPNGMARRHMRDCPGCREFRGHLRGHQPRVRRARCRRSGRSACWPSCSDSAAAPAAVQPPAAGPRRQAALPAPVARSRRSACSPPARVTSPRSSPPRS